MSITDKPIILALTDHKAGHETQTHGIIRLLNDKQQYEVVWVSIREVPKLIQQISRQVVNISKKVFALDYYVEAKAFPEKHELVKFVVSAGGNTLIANILCSRFFKNSQNIIASSLRGINPSNFDVVFSIQSQQHLAPYLYYPISPSKLIQDLDGSLKYQARNALSITQDKKVLTVLIGANTKYVDIGEAEQFVDFIELVNKKMETNIRLITTSRRTALSFENKIKKMNIVSELDQATWVAQGQSCDIKQYIYASDVIICSQESESMIGEAVMSGRLVIVARLGEINDVSYQRFIENLVLSGDILYLSIEEITQLDLEKVMKSFKIKDHEQLLRSKVFSYLGRS